MMEQKSKSLSERSDVKLYEREQGRHKKRIIFAIAMCIVAAIALFVGILNVVVNKYYTEFEVLAATPRKDSNSVQYKEYAEGVLKFSRDGAAGIDAKGNILWNGSYDMNNPQADVCGKYVVIGDVGGKEWYIYNGKDSGTRFEETLSVVQVQVSQQGIVAVMLEDKDSNEVHIYNPYGDTQKLLAEIPTNVKEDGYPMDISISDDGKKLVTAYFFVNEGVGESHVSFYNFDEVGEDKVNRIVGGVDYGETLVHNVEFIDNNTVCILKEDGFALYSMEELPEEIVTETIEAKIQSAVLGSSGIGFVLDSEEEGWQEFVLYTLAGKKMLSKKIDYEYETVSMIGDEIVFLSDLAGIILRNTGSEKFHYRFFKRMEYIFGTKEKNTYIFVDEANIEKVKLIGATRDGNN